MTYTQAAAILAKPDNATRKEREKARAMLRDSARNAKRQARTNSED